MIGRYLEETDSFDFACQQTGDCCRHYTIPCTPYDLVRLRRSTGQPTSTMLAEGVYAVRDLSFRGVFGDDPIGAILDLFGAPAPDCFPVAVLRKTETPRAPACVFLREDGLCGVYADRPGVCRSYPLGRVRTPDGPRWFERDYTCPGKGRGMRRVSAWIAESGLDAYAAGNDRFVAFVERLQAAPVAYQDLPAEQRRRLRELLYDFDAALDVEGCDDQVTLARILDAADAWLARIDAGS